jgi:hypothetical protein
MKETIDSDVSKGSATKPNNTISFLNQSHPKKSLATEKHEKRKKPARVDFSGAKGVKHLSSDYRIIDVDQGPTSNKGGLPACSESVELTLKSAEPTPAYPELARSISQSARLTAPANAQVGLANSK